jgi:2-alkenal reductase
VNSDPQMDKRNRIESTSTEHPYTGCMVICLLTTAFVIGGLLGGMAGGGLVLWATDAEVGLWWATPTPTDAPPPTPTPMPTSSPTPLLPTATPTAYPTPTPSIADVVGQVMPAVVTVVNRQDGVTYYGVTRSSRILGSGIVVDQRGYIVTNYHVVQAADELIVILTTGEELRATLVTSDIGQDLALLRVENGDMPMARWGDSQQIRPGDWVVAIGSALGDFPNSVTVGVVSGVNRALELDEDLVIEGLIQTDAAINKGNSGGPLVNLQGEVIGINTFIIREGERSGVAEGLGFAIPSTMARQLAEEWITADAPPTEE